MCGWSGNSLFALQILQIFTMLGACSTAIVVIEDDWFIVMKCLESCGDFVKDSGVNVPHLSEVTDVE